MRIYIIEDEKPALQHLTDLLQETEENVQLVGSAGSIEESSRWLQANLQPDLILLDIQLADGLAFNLIQSCKLNCPIVFTTAFDKYLTAAFEYNTIDYLLKPIKLSRLTAAIQKYKNLQQHFVYNYGGLMNYLNNPEKKKSRVLVKRGMEFQAVKVEDVVYFFTDHKLIFLVDKDSRKFMVEKSNLAELEIELDNQLFFRANRKYIINANFIKKFKLFDKGKINLELTLPVNEDIIISQENATSFKKWMSEM